MHYSITTTSTWLTGARPYSALLNHRHLHLINSYQLLSLITQSALSLLDQQLQASTQIHSIITIYPCQLLASLVQSIPSPAASFYTTSLNYHHLYLINSHQLLPSFTQSTPSKHPSFYLPSLVHRNLCSPTPIYLCSITTSQLLSIYQNQNLSCLAWLPLAIIARSMTTGSYPAVFHTHQLPASFNYWLSALFNYYSPTSNLSYSINPTASPCPHISIHSIASSLPASLDHYPTPSPLRLTTFSSVLCLYDCDQPALTNQHLPCSTLLHLINPCSQWAWFNQHLCCSTPLSEFECISQPALTERFPVKSVNITEMQKWACQNWEREFGEFWERASQSCNSKHLRVGGPTISEWQKLVCQSWGSEHVRVVRLSMTEFGDRLCQRYQTEHFRDGEVSMIESWEWGCQSSQSALVRISRASMLLFWQKAGESCQSMSNLQGQTCQNCNIKSIMTCKSCKLQGI